MASLSARRSSLPVAMTSWIDTFCGTGDLGDVSHSLIVCVRPKPTYSQRAVEMAARVK
jgi:hypothetical protein